MLYLRIEICWRAQRELQILRKLRKLQELRKITIFARFEAKRVLAKFVAERLNMNCEFYENGENYENCEKSLIEYWPNLWLKGSTRTAKFTKIPKITRIANFRKISS